MFRAVAVKAFATGALVLYSASLASAHVPHWRHYTRSAHAYRIYGSARANGLAMMSVPTRPYQTYSGLGYGGVPENPLIPMKAEVPPPVDPNEPASGSYGAMLEGRNPAPGEP